MSHNTCTVPAFASSAVVAPTRASSLVSSSFVCRRTATVARPAQARWTMGKKAKFGPFSPIVILSSFVLGGKRLNKIRGKAIALHSQAITAFCEFTGTGGKVRTALIKTAKQNGDTLGFLS